MYSWDDIYEMADGAACGEPRLKAKDEARYQVRCLMVESGESDPDKYEIPEERIEDYCDRYGIRFDERGNIVRFELPDRIAEAVYRQKDDEYIKQDILNQIPEVMQEKGMMSLEVSEDTILKMMEEYRNRADCNYPYNSTIEQAIRQVLEGEE